MTNDEIALLAIIRAAGAEGRSSSELRLGVRAVAGQDGLLAALEASGAVRSEPHPLAWAGRRWVAVETLP